MRLPRVSLATVKSRWRAATSFEKRQSRIQHSDLKRRQGKEGGRAMK